MDTSEEYIKQTDCPEIQENHKPKEGDWYHVMDYWGKGETKQRVNFVLSSNVMPQGIGGDWRRVYIPRLIKDLKRKDFCYFGIPFAGDLPHILIWLPRQDQLQAMVRGKRTMWQLVQCFWNWLWTKEPVTTGLSMEQLWLGFVMWELHRKKWTGKEWK